MTFDYNDPRREAERLRIIVETLAYTNPAMTMDEAKDVIPEIERRTEKLERPSAPEGFIKLPDSLPETVAKFIDIQPDIAAVSDTLKINAIKMVRTRTGIGLKEAKEGVEHFNTTRKGHAAPVPSPGYAMTSATDEDIAKWIDGQPDIIDHITAPTGTPGKGMIQGIKEVRARSPHAPGLKEAKTACEHWKRTRPLPKTP